jgi:hypothetical protein
MKNRIAHGDTLNTGLNPLYEYPTDYQFPSYYENILNIVFKIQSLLKETGLFEEVVLGTPETIKNMQYQSVASVFYKGKDFDQTQGLRNRPQFVYTIIGVIGKGTRDARHIDMMYNMNYITAHFANEREDAALNREWITLDGLCRNTEILGDSMNIGGPANNLLTTGVVNLKHDVRFRA